MSPIHKEPACGLRNQSVEEVVSNNKTRLEYLQQKRTGRTEAGAMMARTLHVGSIMATRGVTREAKV